MPQVRRSPGHSRTMAVSHWLCELCGSIDTIRSPTYLPHGNSCKATLAVNSKCSRNSETLVSRINRDAKDSHLVVQPQVLESDSLSKTFQGYSPTQLAWLRSPHGSSNSVGNLDRYQESRTHQCSRVQGGMYNTN